ncbi:MAG: transposase [Brevinema sp.]
MYNNNTLRAKFKDKTVKNLISMSSFASFAELRFVSDISYGLAFSGSSLITDIARSLNENTKISSTCERLYRNATKFNISLTSQGYVNFVKNLISDKITVNIDGTEIVKPFGNKFESLGYVVDASSQSKKLVSGYHVLEMTVPCKKTKHPITIYSKIYSELEVGFESANKILHNAVKEIVSLYGTNITFILDRGYDDVKNFKLFDELGVYFITRLKKNRNYICGKNKRNYNQISEMTKGKLAISFEKSDGTKYELKASHVQVKLNSIKNKKLSIVAVHGFSEKGPMVLLTNKKIQSKEEVTNIFWNYMKRWKIEESFRFNKQVLKYEKIQLLTIKAMQNIVNIIHMTSTSMIKILASEVSILGEEIIKKGLPIPVKKQASYRLYQFVKGIRKILEKSKTTFFDRLPKRKKREDKVITLFDYM